MLIGTLTICSAGFNHLVAVVKMGNWLISFNVYVLCTVWLVVFRKSMSIFEIEIACIFSVFAIWFCIYTSLRSLYCMASCIQNHSMDRPTELSSTD